VAERAILMLEGDPHPSTVLVSSPKRREGWTGVEACGALRDMA